MTLPSPEAPGHCPAAPQRGLTENNFLIALAMV